LLRGGKRKAASTGTRRLSGVPPCLEALEDRTLPATWVPLGPAPQADTAGLLDPSETGNNFSRSADVSGRVTAIAYSSDIGNGVHALFLGTAGGGLWRTTSFKPGTEELITDQPDTPVWEQVSDNLFTQPDGKGDRVGGRKVSGPVFGGVEEG